MEFIHLKTFTRISFSVVTYCILHIMIATSHDESLLCFCLKTTFNSHNGVRIFDALTPRQNFA